MKKTPEAHWSRVGNEPDYRFTLANERTFLAWIRTALALFATGVVLEQLMHVSARGTYLFWLSIAMIAASILASLCAYVRWRNNQYAMRTNDRLKHGYALGVLAAGFAIASITTLLCLIR